MENTMQYTQTILSVLKEESPADALRGRNFLVNRDGYRAIFSSYQETSPFPIARFKEGNLEVPNQVTFNGFTNSHWNRSEWYSVPEEEFLKDYGKEYLKNAGIPMVL
jgi:hypothetical protein